MQAAQGLMRPRSMVSWRVSFHIAASFIYSSLPLLMQFVSLLRRGHPFEIACESINSHSCVFLEVEVQKTTRCFETRPVSKPSALKVPWLSRFSAHDKSIHNAWPLARLRTRLSLCSTYKAKLLECRHFIKLSEGQNISYAASKSLWNHLAQHVLRIVTPPVDRAPKSNAIWLVLPWFPKLVAAGLKSAARNFWTSAFALDSLTSAFAHNLCIRLCWSNAVPNLTKLVTRW